MTAQPALPDVEDVLIGWLPSQLGDVRMVTSVPENLLGSVPLLQVRRVTGAVSSRTQDAAIVDLHAFAVDDAGAAQLAIQAETVLLGSHNITTGGAVVRNVESVARPHWLEYVDTNVQLYTATYTIRLHPVPAGA